MPFVIRDANKPVYLRSIFYRSTLEAAEIAREAEVSHLVLTHHIPSPVPIIRIEKQYIRGITKIFKGKISVGRDLMEIS